MRTSAHALFRYRTSNIGDDTQSYATALVLPRIDALVDRDRLSTLALNQPHICVMNSWFFLGNDSGPPSPAIHPVFHGISVGRSEMLRGEWLEYLRAHAPVGCRDRRSVALLHDAGVDAYWSGCLTLMIGQVFKPVLAEKRSGVYIVDVHPDVEARWVPPALSERATRWTNEFDPLIAHSTGRRFAEVHRRMRLLAHAELVITRRLHVALPCAGFGTPVLTLPNPGISDARHRFSGYEDFLPVIWPEESRETFDFRDPQPCVIPGPLKAHYERLVESLRAPKIRYDWNEASAVIVSSSVASDAKTLGLRLGDDFDLWPAVRSTDGCAAIQISGFPFVDRLAGVVEAAPAQPQSVAAAVDSYAVRRVVDLIAAQLAQEADVVALDAKMRELAQDGRLADVMSVWLPTLRESRLRGLEADWRRTSVLFGVDSYETGRLADVVWRTGDADATRAVITEMRQALASQSFAAHGDAFHCGKNIEILDGFEALLDFDAGAIALEDSRLAALHPYVIAAVYEVMWDAHTAGEEARAIALGLLYVRATATLGHGPETALWIVAHILLPLAAWAQARDVLDARDMSGAATGHVWRRHALAAFAAREMGDDGALTKSLAQISPLFDGLAVEALLGDPSWCDAYVLGAGLLDMREPGVLERERMRLQSFLHDRRARALTSRLALEALANATADDALTLARCVAEDPSAVLTDAGLKAIDVLADAGDWSGAARLYAASGAGLAAAGEGRDLDAILELPDTGWIWSGRGIGDDVLRLKMLTALKGRERAYRYDIDPRLAPLAARALPAMTFLSTPRAVGPMAAGRAAFWMARDGVPRTQDAFRVTRDRFDALRRGMPVRHSEEVFLAYLQRASTMTHDPSPILRPSAAAETRAKALLGGSNARLTMCLAWRSGLLTQERRRFFPTLEELAPLWSTPGIRWVVIQHDLDAEERALIGRTPSLVILPDTDMRNDFDMLTALACAADGVVAPKLSTRDVAAAAGARVLSISLGHEAIEGARMAADGATDRVFPNIRHIRAHAGATRKQVIDDVAGIVRDWSPLTPAA